ncbi:pentatricopeptide repeat-containing protein At1g77405 [Nicotiana sylvestris]|uniref:Pentatricopeptide repeat-containing protein At1g77405-like n=2 Tax=Nicotiana TaxID=4085 RepID=A0A1S3Z7A2_TOBAC|nr:PREDICTED: pentatricopeptide repeat-containing protein At1g77405 [Nicotiana sylvestris]XP_016460082.1 PREDICTED: pentatricopeptide repeat-containing protein At1g77405-like [Nicotiana tabacum]
MLSSRSLSSPNFTQNLLINQVLAAIIRNRPFEKNVSASIPNQPIWTVEAVSQVLRSIPIYLFQSPRSIGRQSGFRHRTPLKQRNLREEFHKARKRVLILGPAAHRDPQNVQIGVDKALEFFHWVETHCAFTHNELTCKEMSLVLAKGGCKLKLIWEFLKKMSRKGLVTTPTVTCLIKRLGEEGLVEEALATFYRMKQFHCKPDVYAYNTLILALCRVGNFKKAKFLLEQMELPGFRCPPDVFTYTILISSYCRYGLETGCRKAIRRRIWEANHLFRLMLFKGFVPDVVTYNSLINGCCKTNRIERAMELLDDMVKRGIAPNRITHNSFIRYYSATNEIDKAIEMLRRMQGMDDGVVACNSSYTPIIHALCEAGRVVEAKDFLVELAEHGSIPREYTYKLVRDALESAGKIDLLDAEFCRRLEDGIKGRIRQVMKMKPLLQHESISWH